MPFRNVEQYILQNKEDIVFLLSDYVLTDTILFWSDEDEIKFQQQKEWQPVIDFINKDVGLHLQKTFDLLPPSENEENKKALQEYLRTLYLKDLTALYLVATELKSVLLATMLIKRKINASEAFKKAFLEELFQNERWGTDKEAENKREQIKEKLLKIEEYLKENG